jgi:hypothetical protein
VQILLALSARDADVGEDLEAAAREHWGAICTLYDRFADKRPVLRSRRDRRGLSPSGAPWVGAHTVRATSSTISTLVARPTGCLTAPPPAAGCSAGRRVR